MNADRITRTLGTAAPLLSPTASRPPSAVASTPGVAPKRNRRPRNAKALRRAVVGLIASAGAFLAFGITPLAMTPSAHADEFDVIIDPIINAISSIDPTLGTDLTAALANLDSAFAGAAAFDPSSAASSLGALSTDVGSATSTANPFDAWSHGLEQDWINSSLGQQVDSSLHGWFAQADPSAVSADDPTAGACGLICQGANGLPGTGENGQGGGLLLGDGGAGGSGAPGGAGGLSTAPGGVGGAGGDGGNGGLLSSHGGAGGTGGGSILGNGGAGGAGGTGGWLTGILGIGGGNGGAGGFSDAGTGGVGGAGGNGALIFGPAGGGGAGGFGETT